MLCHRLRPNLKISLKTFFLHIRGSEGISVRACADLVHTSAAHPLTTNPSELPFPCPPSPFAVPAPKLSRKATSTISSLGSAIKGRFRGALGRVSGSEHGGGSSLAGAFPLPLLARTPPSCAVRGEVCVPCPLLLVPQPGTYRGSRSVAEQMDGQTEGWKGSSPSWCHRQSSPSPGTCLQILSKEMEQSKKVPKETSPWPWDLQSLPELWGSAPVLTGLLKS